MNLKQKVSLLSGTVLPVLAMAAYFLLAPARATAHSNAFYSPCGDDGGCESGSGECYANGSTQEVYVFCYFDGSTQLPPGTGSCCDGYVTCDYGPY